MEAGTLISEKQRHGADPSNEPQPRLNVQTHFAWIRTRMSAERTLEAWVRTALALIGFGFTIVQFFAHLNTMQGIKPPKAPQLSYYVGLLLIGAGILGLLVAMWQYRRLVLYLHSETFRDIAQAEAMPKSTTLIIAVVLCLIGLFAFIAVLIRSS
jgi:putative membrane protein